MLHGNFIVFSGTVLVGLRARTRGRSFQSTSSILYVHHLGEGLCSEGRSAVDSDCIQSLLRMSVTQI